MHLPGLRTLTILFFAFSLGAPLGCDKSTSSDGKSDKKDDKKKGDDDDDDKADKKKKKGDDDDDDKPKKKKGDDDDDDKPKKKSDDDDKAAPKPVASAEEPAPTTGSAKPAESTTAAATATGTGATAACAPGWDSPSAGAGCMQKCNNGNGQPDICAKGFVCVKSGTWTAPHCVKGAAPVPTATAVPTTTGKKIGGGGVLVPK